MTIDQHSRGGEMADTQRSERCLRKEVEVQLLSAALRLDISRWSLAVRQT
jgi:hypothetical protein